MNTQQLHASVFPSEAATVTLDRKDVVILKWMMHELDERTFVSTSEDHRTIFHVRAKNMRDKLESALIAPTPAPGEPTAHEIEAAGRAIWDHAFPGKDWDAGLKEIYCNDARLALVAARAARATGAETK